MQSYLRILEVAVLFGALLTIPLIMLAETTNPPKWVYPGIRQHDNHEA
jgi:hypothetical protein